MEQVVLLALLMVRLVLMILVVLVNKSLSSSTFICAREADGENLLIEIKGDLPVDLGRISVVSYSFDRYKGIPSSNVPCPWPSSSFPDSDAGDGGRCFPQCSVSVTSLLPCSLVLLTHQYLLSL